MVYQALPNINNLIIMPISGWAAKGHGRFHPSIAPFWRAEGGPNLLYEFLRGSKDRRHGRGVKNKNGNESKRLGASGNIFLPLKYKNQDC